MTLKFDEENSFKLFVHKMFDFLRCWFGTSYCCDIIRERVNGRIVKILHSQIKRLKTFLMAESLTHILHDGEERGWEIK